MPRRYRLASAVGADEHMGLGEERNADFTRVNAMADIECDNVGHFVRDVEVEVGRRVAILDIEQEPWQYRVGVM